MITIFPPNVYTLRRDILVKRAVYVLVCFIYVTMTTAYPFQSILISQSNRVKHVWRFLISGTFFRWLSKFGGCVYEGINRKCCQVI